MRLTPRAASNDIGQDSSISGVGGLTMHARKRSTFERIVSGALALSLACSGLLPNVSVAAAASPTPPETSISATASQPASPTVVRELTEKRTETSKELLLSDGTIRAQYFADPIYYQDPVTKALKPIDTTLRETSVDGKPVSVNKANRFRVQLPTDLSDDEVSIEASGTRVQLKPRFKSRIGAARVATGAIEARSASATDRVYPSAFVGATLEYESRPDGIKETIVLDRPIKENVFGFDLTLDGLSPIIEHDGSISLLSVGTNEPVYSIPAPFMMDSSDPTQGDNFSDAVHYEISGTAPTYHLAVVADAVWLADPARVYPVRIDPSVTTVSSSLTVSSRDTFISSKLENQPVNFVNHITVWTNRNNPAANWTEYAYVQPGSVPVSDMASKKSAGYEVVASRLKLVVNSVAAAGSVAGAMCSTSTTVPMSTITWDSYQANDIPTALTGYSTPLITASTGLKIFDVTDMVEHWQDAAVPWGRCTVRLSVTAGGHVGFRAVDDSGSDPVWEIDYAPIPTVAVASPSGGNVTSVPTASWTFGEALGNPQAEWQLEVATSTAGAAIATAGASNTAASSALPAPAGGWVDGIKYYVRVRVASSPSTQVSRLWSPWATKDFTIVPQTPTVSVTSPSGGNVTNIPAANWAYSDPLGSPQVQWQLEVATSTAGAAIATASASNSATSSALPVPSGGWVPSTKYYVRIRVASSPYTQTWWSSWVTKDFTPVTPSAVTAPSSTTTVSASWFYESDTNGDGINDLKNDAADQGRGSAALSWPAASGATGYNVYLFDGYAYRKIGSTTATSWSTAGKRIYPSDTQIAALAANTTANPFLSGTGLDLRDDPRPLYAKTAGTSVETSTSYAFRVAPYNSIGETPLTNNTVKWVTLADRTIAVSEVSPPALLSPLDTTSTTVPSVTWSYAGPQGCAQTGYRIEVATSTTSPAIATADVSSSATSAAMPVPAGGWSLSTYYVRVRTSATPNPSIPIWSGWSAWGKFTLSPPSAVTTLSVTTTASASWFYESDTNGDGLNDLKDDAADQGRGSAALSWPAASGATGYNVYLFDGYAYRKIGSTTATSWSTVGKRIYPSDTQIAALAANTTANPFISGTGLDLRDDPRALYAKTAGASMDATPSYAFRVMPYSAGGESPVAAEATVTLDSRTVGVNIEPQHTDYDIGDMLGHSATARLDQATIELDATDLSIASYGPDASIARHYSSETTLAGAFAPGWCFSFEQNLAVGSSVATWTDSVGEAHRFVLRSGVWVAPDGLQATMSSTGTGYRISFPGGDKLDFRLADGRLISKSDLNDNLVRYFWSVDQLTIIAANQQSIDVFFNGARVTRAEYNTSDGERSVDYEYGFSDEATVTLNSGTTDELPIKMVYDTEGHLFNLVGPPTEGYLGADGNGDEREPARPIWQIDYSGSKLEGTSVMWGWPRYPTSVVFGAHEATITVARDYIAPDGDKQVGESTFTRYEWNPTGTLSRRSDAQGITDDWSDEPLPFNYWTFDYDRANRPVAEVSPSGARTARTYDARGNTISETDAIGATRTYVYDAFDRCTSETDPLGSTTYRSFDSTGNLESEEKVLNVAGERSRTEYVYDGRGFVTSERSKIDTTTWAQTTYDNFALNGEAQSTSNVDVKLGADGAPQTLTSTRHYDEFGDLIWEKDATGRWTTKENTYSISGRQLSSEVVTGTVSYTRYNQVGQARETSTTAPGGAYTGWTRQGMDARGTVYASVVVTAGGNPVSASQSDLDVQGSVVVAKDENGNHPSAQAFDASGRVVRAWAAGVDVSDLSAASRTVYDVEGRAIVSLAPGATASQATTTSYDAVGRSIATTSSDGTWVEYEYDHGGNVVKETRPTEDGESVKTSQYDLAGRLIVATDSDGAQTTSAYDLAGRAIVSGIVGHGGSATVYNTLGQILSQTDTDGMLTKTTYDEAGRMLRLDVAGKTTVTEYDEAGRESKTTDPDGLSIEREYDAFSRVKKQTHKRDAVSLRESTTSYDTLGRVFSASQTGDGIDSVVGYDGVSGKPYSATLAYADSTTTVGFFAADGSEQSRSFAAQGRSTSRSVTRDGQRRVTSVAIPGVTTQAIGYDAAGKVQSQTGLGFIGSGAIYTYGESGQKASESLDLSYPSSDIENTYTYTDEGRLATSTIAGQSTSYGFDDSGNLNVVRQGSEVTTLTYDSSRRLQVMGTTEYGWDETLGRRISMRRSGESSVTYEYTEAGRLARFENLDASTTATYTYGAQGQRDSSVVRVGSITTTTTYVYDGLSLLNLAAQRSDGATYSITYSYGEDQRPWAAVYASSDTTAPTLFYLVTTDRGDVVELTDAAGQPFSMYSYDAWGRALCTTSQAVSGSITADVAAEITAHQPLRYAGYCYDSESETYYLSARQYDPATMQFLTKDPARADGEESAYQYCGGNPAAMVDPSGLTLQTIGRYWTTSSATGSVKLWFGGLMEDKYQKKGQPHIAHWVSMEIRAYRPGRAYIYKYKLMWGIQSPLAGSYKNTGNHKWMADYRSISAPPEGSGQYRVGTWSANSKWVDWDTDMSACSLVFAVKVKTKDRTGNYLGTWSSPKILYTATGDYYKEGDSKPL